MELKSVLAMAGDRDAFFSRLEVLAQEERIDRFLERWGDFIPEFPSEGVRTAMLALFDIAGDLTWESSSFLGMSSQMQVVRVAHRLLPRVQDPAERVSILKEIAAQSRSLSSVVYSVPLIVGEGEGTRSQDDQSLVNDEGLEEVKEILLGRIRSSAAEGKLREYPRLAMILYRWGSWASLEEPKKFVSELVSTDDGLLDFLVGFVTIRMSAVGYSVSRSMRISRSSVEDFADTNSLVDRVDEIKKQASDRLTAVQKDAVEAFLNPEEDF